MRGTIRAWLVIAAALAPVAAVPAADTPWALCGGPLPIPPRPAVEAQESDPEAVNASADRADLSEENLSVLEGNVHVQRGTMQISADRVEYNRATEVVEAHGNIRMWEEGAFATGEHAHVDLGTDRARLDAGSYVHLDAHAHGDAKEVVAFSRQRFEASNATYTTCMPGAEAWVLEAEDIELNRETKVGAARNVWVRLHDVPIFYTPYLTFPLGNERKSGFLTPRAGVSDSTGFDVLVPYYINLAPDRDATVGVRGMTDRGAQLQGEFRYLATWGEGKIAGEYMPDDRKFDDDRAAFLFQHQGTFAPRWSADANVEWVSDDAYFEDLGTSLAVSSTRFLERRGDVTYHGDGWWALGRAQSFQTLDQTIDPTDRPYERLPQFLAMTDMRERNRQLNFSGYAEAVRFDRESSVNGGRFDVEPAISYPLRAPGAFLVPRVAGRFTQYDLYDTAPGDDDTPNRILPIFSVDAGLVFDRHLSLGGRGYVHTIEPRAYYLGVPFDSQNDLPVFDTGERTFRFDQMFRPNRFSGTDRLGDANQVTLALTSRLLDATGREVLHASFGQIRYFRDRDVQLPGVPIDTDSGSDLVMELGVNYREQWRLLGNYQWNPYEDRTTVNTWALRFQPDRRSVVNLAYRFVREDGVAIKESIEQTDVSAAWPIGPNWRVIGRWNYALPQSRTLESFAGIEYDSCCWAFRTVARRYLTGIDSEHNTGIFLQLELKGLAGLGGGTADFLERNIPGFENDF